VFLNSGLNFIQGLGMFRKRDHGGLQLTISLSIIGDYFVNQQPCREEPIE
jgi:hypothetical protein